jgi:hypothetical protein
LRKKCLQIISGGSNQQTPRSNLLGVLLGALKSSMKNKRKMIPSETSKKNLAGLRMLGQLRLMSQPRLKRPKKIWSPRFRYNLTKNIKSLLKAMKKGLMRVLAGAISANSHYKKKMAKKTKVIKAGAKVKTVAGRKRNKKSFNFLNFCLRKKIRYPLRMIKNN